MSAKKRRRKPKGAVRPPPPPAPPKDPKVEPTCLRCEKRFAQTTKESFDPKADVCQCVRPVPSLDGKTVEGMEPATMKHVRRWEYDSALQGVARGIR